MSIFFHFPLSDLGLPPPCPPPPLPISQFSRHILRHHCPRWLHPFHHPTVVGAHEVPKDTKIGDFKMQPRIVLLVINTLRFITITIAVVIVTISSSPWPPMHNSALKACYMQGLPRQHISRCSWGCQPKYFTTVPSPFQTLTTDICYISDVWCLMSCTILQNIFVAIFVANVSQLYRPHFKHLLRTYVTSQMSDVWSNTILQNIFVANVSQLYRPHFPFQTPTTDQCVTVPKMLDHTDTDTFFRY